MIATTRDLLTAAVREHRAVAAFNVFDLAYATHVVAAAESLDAPVILMTNTDVLRRLPVEVFGPALRAVAERASVPAAIHLDHTYEFDVVYRAIQSGYTSVMYDGSQLPYDENAERTGHVVQVAHAAGVSVEGEIGSVAYNEPDNPIRHELTDPDTAARFCRDTGIDAVAVSVGQVHKLTEKRADVDHHRLAQIAAATTTPLVIHGTSGIPEEDLASMARGPVAKFNIGTVLRRAWGDTLRAEVTSRPGQFDYLTLTEAPLAAVKRQARAMIALLSTHSQEDHR